MGLENDRHSLLRPFLHAATRTTRLLTPGEGREVNWKGPGALGPQALGCAPLDCLCEKEL